jgi:hypothetical protein
MTDTDHRKVSFGTPANPGGRLSDLDASLVVEQRPDGTFRVTILCRGNRGGERRESVILSRRRARTMLNQWAPLLGEADPA